MNLNGTKRDNPKFDETLQFLDGLINSGIKLGLESTSNFLACIGNPHEETRFVHVAGTNGKGSVCTLLAAAFKACGLRTGFFSSPHLVNLRERLRVDGVPITEEEFAELATEMRERGRAVFHAEQPPTFFEFMTVLGFLFFARKKCDIAVMEVGMGGRLDSTNVLTPLLAVITSIGMDHVVPLGGTLESIAGEKAGIIKPGIPVIIDDQLPAAKAVLERIAAERNAPLTAGGVDFAGVSCTCDPVSMRQQNTIRVGDRTWELDTALTGPHQLRNTSVAWAAVCRLQKALNLDLEAAREGFRRATWPSRLQLLPDGILLDAAHNPDAMDIIVGHLRDVYPKRRWNLLFGCLKNKEWQAMLRLLAPLCASVNVVAFDHKRLQPPAETAAFLRGEFPGLTVNTFPDPLSGLQEIRRLGQGLILGSLYLAGEILNDYYHGEPVPVEDDTE